MKKQDVLEAFCKLSALVGENVFKNQQAFDCFCGENPIVSSYAFSEQIMLFIEDAVKEKMEKHMVVCKKEETRNLSPFAQLKHFSEVGDKLGMIRSLRMMMNGAYNHETGKTENGLLRNEDLGLDDDIGLMEAKLEVHRVFNFSTTSFDVNEWICKGICLGYKNSETGVWVWNNL